MQKTTTIISVLALLAAFAAGFFLRPAVWGPSKSELELLAERMDTCERVAIHMSGMIREDIPDLPVEKSRVMAAAALYNLYTTAWSADTWNFSDWMVINIKPDNWEVHIPIIDWNDKDNPFPSTRVLLVKRVGNHFYAKDKYHARF
jgi:hypothetical protein